VTEPQEWSPYAAKKYMERINDETNKQLEVRIAALEKLVDERRLVVNAALKAIEDQAKDAYAKADKVMDKAEALALQRGEQQNEWRATVNDVMSTMLTRNEYKVAHEALVKDTNAVAASLARHEGEAAGIKMSTGTLFAIIAATGIGVTVVVTIIETIIA